MAVDIKMWINGSRVIGNATVDKLVFRLVETRLHDVDATMFEDLGLFGAQFVEKLITEILEMGIAMPTLQGVVLKNPR
jgi:hypothetical protein